MRRIILYILILLISGCVKKAEWESPQSMDQWIVVEGILTDELSEQSVYIHYNKAGINDKAIPLSGADVIISNDESTYQLKEDPQNAGTYTTDTIVVAQLKKSYSLLIYYQETFYSAQAYMVEGKPFPELQYKESEDNELFHIDYVASSFEAEDPAMWEILIDWSTVPGYENAGPEETRRRLLFYTLPTLDVSQVFAPVIEQVFFPAGTRIDERRYSLNPAHADFIRSLLLETSWQGGVFPSDPANVSTNLSEGALGFFGICAVNSLSLTVEKKK